MSQSFVVECPHCHASGELSDPGLLGQSIICPACQMVFTAPTASQTEAPAVGHPDPGISGVPAEPASPEVAEPQLPPELLQPVHVPGEAEEQFVSTLPQPVARGSIQPPKPKNVILITVAWSTVSSIVLFATYMFLAGDPWRGYDAKYAARDAEAARQQMQRKNQRVPIYEERSLDEAVARIRDMAPPTPPSTPSEPDTVPVDAAPVDPTPTGIETSELLSLADIPIETMPAPEVETDVVPSALKPENATSEESR